MNSAAKGHEAEQLPREEERKAEFDCQQQQYEAEQTRRTELRAAPQASFKRILDPLVLCRGVAEYYVGGTYHHPHHARTAP